MSFYKSIEEIAQHGLSWLCQWLWRIAINYGGLVIITLGIALIVFCGLTFIVCVTPAITQAYSWEWCTLHCIATYFMFQILFNYICATVFSAQLGSNHNNNHNSGCPIDRDPCTRCRSSEREMHQFNSNNLNDDSTQKFLKRHYNCLEREYCEYSKDEENREEHEMSTLVEVREENDIMSTNTTHLSSGSYRISKSWSIVKRQLVAKYKTILQASFQHKPIDKTVLLELEKLAHQAEVLPFHERRFILLDTPRRYCVTCERLKAPREHHCKVCNRCVAKMDHHCPWINNCVDLENEKYFVIFLVHLWVACDIVCVILSVAFWCYAAPPTSISSSETINSTLSVLINDNNIKTNTNIHLTEETVLLLAAINAEFAYAYIILNSFPVFLLFALSIVVCVFVGILLLMHLQEVCNGTTPIERLILRDYYYRARRAGQIGRAHIHSPYDLGSKWRNLLEVLQHKEDK